jgi:hypothetical protein
LDLGLFIGVPGNYNLLSNPLKSCYLLSLTSHRHGKDGIQEQSPSKLLGFLSGLRPAWKVSMLEFEWSVLEMA